MLVQTAGMIVNIIIYIDPPPRHRKLCQTTKRSNRQSGFLEKVTVTFLSYDL